MNTTKDPLVQVVSYSGSSSGVWIRQSTTLHKVLPFCQLHNRMGRWVSVSFDEDLGDGVQSVVDSEDRVICEACE